MAKVILESSKKNLKDALECRWKSDPGSLPTTFFKELVKKMPGKQVKFMSYSWVLYENITLLLLL